MDYFYSVKHDCSYEEKIKRSRFIAHLHYCETMRAAKEYISLINKEHKNANHNCWAYIVGKNAENEHCSDAGEPSGSAGKPMLNSLKKHNTTNIVAVVTRYFGGVKLGIRGLIDAYGSVVEKALEQNQLIKLVDTKKIVIETTYDFSEKFKYDVKELLAVVIEITYLEKVTYNIEVESSLSKPLFDYLEELSGSKKIIYRLIEK